MPYTLTHPPDRIKHLPKGAQRIWIGAYNGAWKVRPKDEAYCNAVAWSQVKKKYKKDAQGKWVLKTATEEASHEYISSLIQAAAEDRYGRDVWVVETYDDRVIIRREDEKYVEVSYTFDEDGQTVTLGDDAVEVERVYQAVEEGCQVFRKLREQAAESAAPVLTTLEPRYAGIQVLEEEGEGEDKPFRIRGTALIDNAKSDNRRYYTKEFNDKALAATNEFMEQGGVVTVFARHGKAVGNPLIGQLPEGLPIGMVDKPFYRSNGKVRYEAEIFPTTEGKDAQIIIKRGGMRSTSIRAHPFESKQMKLPGGEEVEVMISAVIIGIDLAEHAGIAGCGIDEILEEAPTFADASPKPKEESMEWEKLTLEELLEHRKDLLDAYLENHEQYKAQAAKITELEEKVAGLTQAAEEAKAQGGEPSAEAKAALEKVPGLEETIKTLNLQLAIQKASHIGVSAVIAEELAKVVTEEAKIEEALPGIRATAIAKLLEAPSAPAAGKGQTVVDDKTPPTEPLTEEKKEVVRLTGGQPEGVTTK